MRDEGGVPLYSANGVFVIHACVHRVRLFLVNRVVTRTIFSPRPRTPCLHPKNVTPTPEVRDHIEGVNNQKFMYQSEAFCFKLCLIDNAPHMSSI